MLRLSNFLFVVFLTILFACGEQEAPEKITNHPILLSDTINVSGKELKTFVLPAAFQKRTPWISMQATKAAEADLFRQDNGQWALRYRAYDGLEAQDQLWIDSDVKPSEHHSGESGNQHFSLFGPHDDTKESCVETVQRLQLLIRILPKPSEKK